MSITRPHHLFASSNSAEGFENHYPACFSDARCDRLYIVKGGPGTGKSRFLGTIARHARAHGYDVTTYACSSDPSSLDGVLLERPGAPRLGLIDGTAPHVAEPVIPGAREELVNLGAFWDSARLAAAGEDIRRLGAAKSAAYTRAYAYLAAAGRLDAVADALVAPAVRDDRLRALATRLLRGEPGGEGKETPALRRALTMSGRATLHSFEESAASLLVVEDTYGLGARLLAHLRAISRARGLDVLVSHDPLIPAKADGLFYPASGLCILVGDATPREGCPTRTLSLRRYLDPDRLRPVRAEARRALTHRTRIEDEALGALAEAATHHFALEALYSAAMDFPAVEAFTEAFCERILAE